MSTKNKREELLLEAVRGFLSSDDARLGLEAHEDTEESSHHQWHQWENIDDMFSLKANESPFRANMTAAFYTVHSSKYLDDPTFAVAMDKELSAHGLSRDDRSKALKYIEEIKTEMGGNDWGERDAGWNPNMDEIADMTRNADRREAPTSEPFTGGGPAPDKNGIEGGYDRI